MQKSIIIGNARIPALGFGTYKLTGREGEKAIEQALAFGYRHIDTAGFYANETEVGNAVRNSGINRDDIFITTKVWPSNFTGELFVPSVEESLRKLRVDTVDLLLLHWPADDETNKLATGLLNECFNKQYARLVGVSNFSLPQLQDAQGLAPVCCNQVEYNPYKNLAGMLQYLQTGNLLLTAYMPLARGLVLKDPVIQALSKKYNKTGSQVVLRWLLQQDNVAAIPKASSEKHCLENLQVFGFELEQADMQMIFGLQKP
jgi:diketogulonate reductase-like aldo/keto reductase